MSLKQNDEYYEAKKESLDEKKKKVSKKMKYDVRDKNTLHKSSKMAHQNTHKILD